MKMILDYPSRLFKSATRRNAAMILGDDLLTLASRQAEWSQATFGSDDQRGPQGPLKHLALEAQECLDNPTDPVEYADCFLLILDAARRAGFSFTELVEHAMAKHEVNRKRSWFRPVEGEPVRHVA